MEYSLNCFDSQLDADVNAAIYLSLMDASIGSFNQASIILKNGRVYVSIPKNCIDSDYLDSMIFSRETEYWKLSDKPLYVVDCGAGYKKDGIQYSNKCGFKSIAGGLWLNRYYESGISFDEFTSAMAYDLNYNISRNSEGIDEHMRSDYSLDSICYTYNANITIINLIADVAPMDGENGDCLYNLREGCETFPTCGRKYPVNIKLVLMSGHYQLVIPSDQLDLARKLFGNRVQNVGSEEIKMTQVKNAIVMTFKSENPKTEYRLGTEYDSLVSGQVTFAGNDYIYYVQNGQLAYLTLNDNIVTDSDIYQKICKTWHLIYENI